MFENLIPDIITLALLLAVSGFFSSSEIAIFSLNPARIKKLIKQKKKNSTTLEKIKKDPQKLLITILIGNNIANVVATSYSTLVAYRLTQGLNEGMIIAIVTGILTFLILVFGEITPKNIAIKHNVGLSLFSAPILNMLMNLIWPLVFFFEIISNSISKLFIGNFKNEPLVTEEEVSAYVSMGVEEGTIEKQEKEIIHRVFQFNDIPVEEIMTQRSEIMAIKENWPLKKVKEYYKQNPFTRLPVYKESLNSIEGIIHLKDIFSYSGIESKFSVRDFIRTCLFVPETKKIDKLLEEFQSKKIHMAMVVNEYGGIVGLVTIEDVLEELVGEIEDEIDERISIDKINKKNYIAKGETTLEMFNDYFELKIESEDFDTIAGYIMGKLDKIPFVGDSIIIDKYKLFVRRVKNKKIITVEIKILE